MPIEPIIGTKPLKESELFVDVASRVLAGPSVADWFEKYKLFETEILDQIKLILEGFDRWGVAHGHPHNGNFIVMFERTESGEADFHRIPRVYIIDFDMAISPAK